MDWWVWPLAGALVAGFVRLLRAMKVWYEMLQARRHYLNMKEEDNVRRVAEKIETIMGPKVGKEYGNVFQLDFIAQEINEGKKITHRALLYLQEQNRASRQSGDWWKLEPRANKFP